jgi:hypothetical protein
VVHQISGGAYHQELVTDERGELELTFLDPGVYQIWEIVAPDGFLIDAAVRTVEIAAGKPDARFVFTNTRKPALEVLKYDPVEGKYLPGAVFRIARIADGSHYLDRVTDAQGKIRIDDLEPSVYSVQEIAAPSGYIQNDTEYHVELFPGKTSQLVAENIKKPSLIVWKYDMTTAEKLPNTEFSVAHKGGSVIHEGVTDSDGKIRLDNLDEGWYTVTELAPPPGYLNSVPASKDVYLEPGKVTYFETRAPAMSAMITVFIVVGWALLIGNCVFQAMKTMLSGLGFEGESPGILLVRTGIFGFLLLASRQVCELGLGISGSVIALLELPSNVELVNLGESAFSGVGSAGWLLVIIFGVIMMFNLVKLLFEIGERYVIVAVLTFMAPLAFAMGGAKSTHDFFKGWVRMYASMLLMMVMNVVF